ncbi:MAG: radical SAM protein [Bacteroidales bacterium]|nr:radical SAM protein [Bacteroidales bacterium]
MKIFESYIILRKLTLRKIVNAIKLYLSYLLFIVFKTKIRRGYPVSISVEPTSFCNLECPECPAGKKELTRFNGNIDFGLYRKIIDEFSPYLLNLILYFQGEPYLNKEIFKLIEYSAKEKKVFTTSSTNGHYLNEENAEKTIRSGLDRLIISVDGTTQEVYEQYRKKGDLNKVTEGIKNIVHWKKKLKSKTPQIVLQFLVFKFNEHQINDIKLLSKKLGADKFELKSAQIYNFENDTTFIPTNDKYSRYKKAETGKYIIKNKLKNRCKRMWESSVITNTGDVLHCCFDKNADYSYGNLKETSFKKLNNNSSALMFRKMLNSGRKQIDICKNCTEGLFR